jgi:hypothetical protein
MTFSSHSEFVPAKQVIKCPSADGIDLKIGDVVYQLHKDASGEYKCIQYSVMECLADTRIKIVSTTTEQNKTTKLEQVVLSRLTWVQPLPSIIQAFTEQMYQFQIALPKAIESLKQLASKMNPEWQLDNLEVGDDQNLTI